MATLKNGARIAAPTMDTERRYSFTSAEWVFT